MNFKSGIIILAAFSMLAGSVYGRQEDEIRTQSAQYQGVVQSATPRGVAIRLSGTGNEITVPHAAIISMRINEPRVVTEGIRAFEAGRMPEAARYLARTVAQYQALDVEWAVKSLIYYGRASLATGDYENAEKAFKAFLAWYPDNERLLEARLGMAQIDVAKEEYEVALEKLMRIASSFDAQLKPPPEEVSYAAEAYLSIGQCLEALGQYREALDSFLKAIAVYPDERVYPEALYRSGLLFAKFEDFKRAEGAFEEIARDFPTTEFASGARRELDTLRLRASEAVHGES